MKAFNKKPDARKITGIALFVALEVALCFITNYVQFGAVNINLALFPIVIGACVFGPWIGLILGLLNGLITIFAPATLAFISLSPAATVFVCLFKTSLAGFLGGLFYKLIAKKNTLIAAFVAAVTVPVVNTFVFILGSYIFFADLFATVNTEGKNMFVFLITTFIGLNFLIEVISNLVIDPAICKAIKLIPREKSKTEAHEEARAIMEDIEKSETEAKTADASETVNDVSEVEIVYDPDKE